MVVFSRFSIENRKLLILVVWLVLIFYFSTIAGRLALFCRYYTLKFLGNCRPQVDLSGLTLCNEDSAGQTLGKSNRTDFLFFISFFIVLLAIRNRAVQSVITVNVFHLTPLYVFKFYKWFAQSEWVEEEFTVGTREIMYDYLRGAYKFGKSNVKVRAVNVRKYALPQPMIENTKAWCRFDGVWIGPFLAIKLRTPTTRSSIKYIKRVKLNQFVSVRFAPLSSARCEIDWTTLTATDRCYFVCHCRTFCTFDFYIWCWTWSAKDPLRVAPLRPDGRPPLQCEPFHWCRSLKAVYRRPSHSQSDFRSPHLTTATWFARLLQKKTPKKKKSY